MSTVSWTTGPLGLLAPRAAGPARGPNQDTSTAGSTSRSLSRGKESAPSPIAGLGS